VDVREPILVLPFDTRVTSPGLKDVGQLAADRIESAIEEAALGAVKPRRAALGATEQGGATPEMLSRIARSSGAATLVTGVIYQRGDTVEVQSQVLRARDLKTVFSLRAAQGLAGNAGRVVDEAKERILGAVGYYVSPESRGMDPSLYTPPSTLALFRLWTRANQLFNQGKFVEAIPVQQEILRRDSTQFYVAEQLAGALFNLGRSRESDSILRVMETRRGRLPRGETLVLDISQSLRASPEDEWRAATAAFQVDSQAFAYLALYAAERTNHLSQATRFYHLRDTSSSWGRDWQAWYSVEAAALHGLGRYDQELALAREARTRDPGNSDHAFTEARALLALGRMAELEQVLTASRALPDYRAPGTLMHRVAAELLEHRTKAEYQRMFERALAWNQALPADRRQDRQVRQEMAVENYYLGRYAEAARLFADLGREFPDEPLYVNSAARIAASQGDTAAALRRIEELRADTLRNNGLEVSRIFALLGRKVEAVAALRDYLNHGGRYDLGWHATDLELIALRDYPPFIALVALKE
jgi:thioredoxin-like negative regulator of GroEL